MSSSTRSRSAGLVASPIVVAPLFFAQEMTGLPHRVSRILVEPARGMEGQVRAALVRLARIDALNVEGTDYDERLFAKAASASNQSTALFAVISALVGFLFAFNAMLLTVPQRRRLIAELRRDGYTPKTVIGVLLLDAFVLGVTACVLGLLLGEELSIHLFHSNPGYLGSAFAVGTQTSRRVAEHRDRCRRRDARGGRRGVEPAARHPLPRSARRDHTEGGLCCRPRQSLGRAWGFGVPGGRDGSSAWRAQAGDPWDGPADRRPAAGLARVP